MRDTILFDLDGTLLNMDTDAFIDQYFQLLVYYFREDISRQAMGGALKKGVYAMMNEIGQTNYDVFCEVFHQELGVPNGTHEPKFREFYLTQFDKLQPTVAPNPVMQQAFAALKGKGYRFALATNPAFPMVAQQKRLSWAGLDAGDFALITACDNSTACKPFEEYYSEITTKLQVSPNRCYMVGNDIDDDMIAGQFGFEPFLVTDNLVDKKGTPYEGRRGDSAGFLQFAEGLCTVL